MGKMLMQRVTWVCLLQPGHGLATSCSDFRSLQKNAETFLLWSTCTPNL